MRVRVHTPGRVRVLNGEPSVTAAPPFTAAVRIRPEDEATQLAVARAHIADVGEQAALDDLLAYARQPL